MSQPVQPPILPPSSLPRKGQSTRRLLVVGVVALAVGGWLLLNALGVPVPDLGHHWPLFLLLGGLGSIADYLFLSRRPAAFGLGVLGLGLGTFFYCFSLDLVQPSNLAGWGPAIPLILGLAFLASWLVGKPRDPSFLTIGIVGVGLAVTGWGWRILRVEILWALVLLGVGGFFIWRAVKQSRSNPPPPT